MSVKKNAVGCGEGIISLDHTDDNLRRDSQVSLSQGRKITFGFVDNRAIICQVNTKTDVDKPGLTPAQLWAKAKPKS